MDAQEHPDVAAELTQRTGQGLAVLATLGEAAARLAVEELRRRADKERNADRRDERLEKASREQDRLARFAAERQAQQDRSVIGRAEDPEWLKTANLKDLGETWRTARVREAEFPEAAAAAERVEERLREMYPRPMDLYDQAVAAGVPRAEAMRAAAGEMSRTPVMRAHGGRNAAALPAGETVGPDTFDQHLQAERGGLAAGVNPQAYRTELARLGAGGTAAADALEEILAARAGQELQQAAADTATQDDRSTPAVDEHTAGLARHRSTPKTSPPRSAGRPQPSRPTTKRCRRCSVNRSSGGRFSCTPHSASSWNAPTTARRASAAAPVQARRSWLCTGSRT